MKSTAESGMNEGVRLYAGTQAGLIAWRSGTNGCQEVGRPFEEASSIIFGCTATVARKLDLTA